MASYESVSKLGQEKIKEKAQAYFGSQGLGLTINSNSETGLSFEGGGGFVSITLSALKKGSKVDIETREWDYQVKEFLGKI